MKHGLLLAIRLGAYALALLLLVGLLGAVHPAFDSIGHFRLHGLALSAVALVALAWLRRWRSFGVLLASGVVALAATAPALPGFAPADGGGTANFTVAQQNLLYLNALPEQAALVLARSKADVLLLQEVDGPEDPIVARLRTDYPAQTICPFRNRRAVAILSRRPFAAPPRCARGRGLVTAPLEIAGRPVTFASLHALWPWPHRQWNNVQALEAAFDGLSGPMVVGGDFNAAPWSAFVSRLAAGSRTRPVGGLRFTFNLKFLPQGDTRFGGLPLDHVLHSPELEPTAIELLPHAGSDHLGSLVRFRFAS